VKNEIKYHVEIEISLGDVLNISGHVSGLGQVFLNTIVNSAQAITSDGLIQISSYVEGDCVVITIKGNGHGICETIQEKIFDPFYTTKDVGQGTGLGLSIAQSIVRKHGGSIQVESVVDEGTVFEIRLPIQQKDPSD
jgi:two-component system NtrC family sensor kinase